MKYPTKQKRCCALFEAYLRIHKKTEATAGEVAAWAVENGLYPVPVRQDWPQICAAWEKRLEALESP